MAPSAVSDALLRSLGISLRRSEGSSLGDCIRPNDTVAVFYVGTRMADGQLIDAAQREQGQDALIVRVGAGQVMLGWDIALLAMRERERATVLLPANLAYGIKGKPPRVPPNSDLTFELEVCEILRDPGTLALDAAARGDAATLRALMDSALGAVDRRGWTPHHAAADAGASECVFLLLQAAAVSGTLARYVDAQVDRPKGASALHLAVRSRDELCVSLLLHAGASPQLSTERGKTPLAQAEEYGSERLMHLLRTGGSGASATAAAGGAPCVLCGARDGGEFNLGIGPLLCTTAERQRNSVLWASRVRAANPRVWMRISCTRKGGDTEEGSGGDAGDNGDASGGEAAATGGSVEAVRESGDEQATATIEFELYKDIVPKTAENFRQLCTGEAGRSSAFGSPPLCFKGCAFHRIVPGQIMQGGDFTVGGGRGGESIYGRKFADESFEGRAGQHRCAGLLSMANSGRDSNGSQFFITLSELKHLDGKHVVFGRVSEGLERVLAIAAVTGSGTGATPQHVVRIEDCGEC
jgi:cyclophilin family peptidyl-prolyl cis-trans isomerase